MYKRQSRYLGSLFSTVVLSAAVTLATLVLSTIAGLFLVRRNVPGKRMITAMLTFPLAFPGVVVGFMVILLAGRQGLLGDVTHKLIGERNGCSPIPSAGCFSATCISRFRAWC